MLRVVGRAWASRCVNCLPLLPLLAITSVATLPATAQSPAAAARAQYEQLPLRFEPNQGQFAPDVRFRSSGPGYSVALTQNEAVVRLRAGTTHSVVGLALEGAPAALSISGEDRLPGTVNYFTGSNRAAWRTGIPTYGRVRVANALPGVDLVYYGNQNQLEFDLVLAAGMDPANLKLRVRGARAVSVAQDGSVVMATSGGPLTLRAPVAYQRMHGTRTSVKAQFRRISGDEVGFAVEAYDRRRPLTIDPVLVYATYLGGSYFDAVSAVAVDAGGNAYVTGNADSCDFPTTGGAYQTSAPSGYCYPGTHEAKGNLVFVAKINAAGTGLVYSTYLGMGAGTAIAVDASGDAYVAGWTEAGFPVTSGAYQSTDRAAGNGGTNSFVTELNPAGTSLVYSTYLGGSWGQDQINAIAVDSSGNAYVAGSALSQDFPATTGAYQTTDAMPGAPFSFVTKLNSGGGTLAYSTYLMGTGTFSTNGAPVNAAHGIAVDSAGNAYVAGTTSDQAFPVTSGAFQTGYTDSADQAAFRQTGYVAKINPTGSGLAYASYLGGGPVTQANAVAVDASGNAYVTGAATANLATTSGAFESAAPGYDAFVARVNTNGSALAYATYLGGSCTQSYLSGTGDAGLAIAVDSSGNAYVAGQACSQDFPVTQSAVQTAKLVTNPTAFDGFFSVLNATGSGLLYSTYLGGNGNLNPDGDWTRGIALDAGGDAIVGGLAESSNFPVSAGALQASTSANGAGFVARLTIPAGGDALVNRDFTVTANPATMTLTQGQSGTATITVTPQNGFQQPVTLSCSGAPAGATCSFDQTQLSMVGGAATATLTVNDTSLAKNEGLRLGWAPYSWGAVLLCCFGFARRKRGELLALLCVGFLSLSLLSGCGGIGKKPGNGNNGGSTGGSGGSGGSGGGTTSTVFTVTVTATAATVQHTTAVTVTAQ
ncbi:MAG TPA: SBBP repeat-containing protein [Acidobacteriaceae bacterium]|jgi:VCBS repeat-containing protein|nr:SBBP repeat-containing protein [Acidobacteriaceae bacterium]